MSPDECELARWEGEGGAVPPDHREPCHGPSLLEIDEFEPSASEEVVIERRD